MKFNHTVKVAFSLNLWVENDRGHRVDTWLLPVQCLFFWIPAWLYKSLMRKLSPRAGRRRTRTQANPASLRSSASRRQGRSRTWPFAWLFDLAGWKNDLPVIIEAGALLLKERRFAYDLACA